MRRRELVLMLPLILTLAVGAALLARPAAAPTVPPALPSSIDRVLGLIRDRYVDPVDDDALVRVAAEAMLRYIEDPYAAFLAGPALSAYRGRLTGEVTGLGLTVGRREGRLTALAVLEGSPASEAGVRPGDEVVAIGDRPADDLSAEQGAYLLDDADGPDVVLVIRPGLAAHPDTLHLERRRLPLVTIPAAGLAGEGVAYVAVRGISDGTADEVARRVDSLLELGARGLVLDLRGNGGGRLREGVRLADHFLPPEAVIAERERRGDPDPVRLMASGAERWPGLRVAVLVDAGTASAAEIVAGALQGHQRAVLVGTHTFGKSGAQDLFEVGDGTVLRLTTGRWRLPSGDTLVRHAGLVPDIEVRPAAEDPRRVRWRAALGERWPRFEGTVRRFVAGWAPLCGAPAPSLSDAATRQAFRRALVADSVFLPALFAREARDAVDGYLDEFATRENCGESTWRVRAIVADPVFQAGAAAVR